MDTDSLKTNIKRFFSNPNTLTFLLVITLIVVVYFVYSYMVKRAVSPVNVPYATSLLIANQQITDDAIGTVKISGNFVTASGEGLIQSRFQVRDKYVASGYQIPQNSFFYQDALASEKEAQKTVIADAPDGYTVFALDVDFDSTYGCSIMSGNYIDLFFKARSDDGYVIYDLFIKSLKVTLVVDKDGKDVFGYSDAQDDNCQPSKMYFLVPDEYNTLLNTAMLISTNDIEIIPVPRNAGYSENPEETRIANEAIENFILSKAVYIAN